MRQERWIGVGIARASWVGGRGGGPASFVGRSVGVGCMARGVELKGGICMMCKLGTWLCELERLRGLEFSLDWTHLGRLFMSRMH